MDTHTKTFKRGQFVSIDTTRMMPYPGSAAVPSYPRWQAGVVLYEWDNEPRVTVELLRPVLVNGRPVYPRCIVPADAVVLRNLSSPALGQQMQAPAWRHAA